VVMWSGTPDIEDEGLIGMAGPGAPLWLLDCIRGGMVEGWD